MRTLKGKTTAILLAGSMLALTACGGGTASSVAESTESKTESTAQATAEPAATAEPTAEPTTAPSATWQKEPFFEAEYFNAIPYGRPVSSELEGENADYNSTRNLETADGLMAFSNQPADDFGGQDKGIIDAEGNVLAEDAYMVFCGYGGKYALTSYGDGANFTSYTIDADGKLQPMTEEEELTISGTSTNPELCWVADEGALHVWGAGDTYIQPDAVTVKEPVAATWLDTMPEDQMVPYDPDKPNECVLTDGTKPITEDKYEAVGAYNSGVFAVKKDGKWGYADITGALVIPCEYDASWATETAYSSESSYAATENTVVLCKNGEYALYGTDNTEIIPFGEYEALRPVYNGTLWAKQDGKWGILKLN